MRIPLRESPARFFNFMKVRLESKNAVFCFPLHWPVFGLLKWCNLQNNVRIVVWDIFSWMKLWNILFLLSTVSLKSSPLLLEKVSTKCEQHSCLQVSIRKLARFLYSFCALASWWALRCKREKCHYSRKSKSLRKTRKALWAFLAGKGQDGSFLWGSFQTGAYYTRKDIFVGEDTFQLTRWLKSNCWFNILQYWSTNSSQD